MTGNKTSLIGHGTLSFKKKLKVVVNTKNMKKLFTHCVKVKFIYQIKTKRSHRGFMSEIRLLAMAILFPKCASFFFIELLQYEYVHTITNLYHSIMSCHTQIIGC